VDDEVRLAAEQRARVLIDQQLTGAGWAVVDRKDLNLFTPRGSAVREAIVKPGHGRADYLLYVDKQVVGVIEAKAQGTPLSGVEWQSAMFATGLPEVARQRPVLVAGRLPFVFQANGVGDALHQRLRPAPAGEAVLRLPAAENPGPVDQRGK